MPLVHYSNRGAEIEAKLNESLASSFNLSEITRFYGLQLTLTRLKLSGDLLWTLRDEEAVLGCTKQLNRREEALTELKRYVSIHGCNGAGREYGIDGNCIWPKIRGVSRLSLKNIDAILDPNRKLPMKVQWDVQLSKMGRGRRLF